MYHIIDHFIFLKTSDKSSYLTMLISNCIHVVQRHDGLSIESD